VDSKIGCNAGKRFQSAVSEPYANNMLEMSTQGKTKKEFKFDISFEKKNEKKRNMLQTPEKNKGFPFLLLIRQDQCFPWTN